RGELGGTPQGSSDRPDRPNSKTDGQMKELGQISDNLRIVKEWEVIGAPSKLLILRFWCERGDSNPHGCPLDPKSSASASSATLALGKIQRYFTSTGRKTRVENRAC